MNILAIGAHWDDIELGCCLTLERLRKQGANLYGVVLTDSETHMETAEHDRTAEQAAEEGLAAFATMGIEFIGTPPVDQGMLEYDTLLMRGLDLAAHERKIDTVFTHWHGDVNTDHRAAWELSRVAFRHVPNLLCYRSNGYSDGVTRFEPNLFCGFSEQEYGRKLELLRQHASAWGYREDRWQWEILNQEWYWGHLCSHDYAEAFQVCRLLNPWEAP